jgi:hypothetical protein
LDLGTIRHAVFIDGVIDNDSIVVKEADRWNLSDPKNRRVVFLTSDGVPKKFNGQQASEGDQATFRQWSWTLEEYHVALNDSTDRSRAILDAQHDLIDDPVDAKYFFAGGSARYMFGFPTTLVKDHIVDGINEHFRAINNGQALTTISPVSVHRIFAYFGPSRTTIISEFAQAKMLEQFGMKELLRLAKHPFLKENNSTVGTLFETFFRFLTMQSKKSGDKFEHRGDCKLVYTEPLI